MGETQAITKNWMGSLLEGQRDVGGQMYMRNRYYDPKTGQFTQTDPIGIASGLNTYGFAAGDPVGNRDPLGLKICAKDHVMQRRIEQTYQMDIPWDDHGCIDEHSVLTRHGSSSSLSELQDQFEYVLRTGLNIEVEWRSGGGSIFKEPSWIFDDADIGIDPRQAYENYGIESGGRCASANPWGVHALIAHEFGHAYNFLKTRDGVVQGPAIASENLFNRTVPGRRPRSERCHP